jgi:NMD protein affecting ribosome stability and mRNA decay
MAKYGRRDRLIKERVHDPYMTRAKLPDPTICPECRVVFTKGRWQWLATAPTGGDEELCPACRRIRDQVPAGLLTLKGSFFDEHRSDIMNLLHNKVEAQKAQHPMERIMDVEDQDDGSAVVTFTDIHLAQGVGEAIERAYDGELDILYADESAIVRVRWER